jgi:cation diffusion facilitator CzcD-associated flavoprotein CzcO
MLNYTAKYSLRAHCVFDTDVTSARWDEIEGIWRVSMKNTKAGVTRTACAKVVMSATGPLSQPNTNALPGAENFKGALFHSAQWDHTVELKGKQVGLIGNGCSAWVSSCLKSSGVVY